MSIWLKKTNKYSKTEYFVENSEDSVLSTYEIFNNYNIQKPNLILNNIQIFKKIGNFQVRNKIIIGDRDFTELNLKKGEYTAYQINNNLAIIRNSKNLSKSEISSWIWSYSGKGVNISKGTFGFFDSYIIDKINNYYIKKIKKRGYSKQIINWIKNNLPEINNPNKKYIIVNTNMIKNILKLNSEFLDIDYGVIYTNNNLSGLADCYIIGHNKALLKNIL